MGDRTFKIPVFDMCLQSRKITQIDAAGRVVPLMAGVTIVFQDGYDLFGETDIRRIAAVCTRELVSAFFGAAADI